MSSPRPWGCFLADMEHKKDMRVFPTPVGVFLLALESGITGGSLPHARGGVSYNRPLSQILKKSSPRPWGVFLLVAL
ncbi:conserved hypothetical protein [methanotrophic bacterial endosymbiont of Bathymodiolus sp.]|nr:conserved hypothetical protein [methanotrophic bacterial endosymbiont of Bathymodiolus sp.]